MAVFWHLKTENQQFEFYEQLGTVHYLSLGGGGEKCVCVCVGGGHVKFYTASHP